MCVLFVEDEPLIALVARDVLEEAGHEVVVARSGDEAAGLLEAMPGRFICLVTDFTMPGAFSGIDLVNWVRPLYPRLPVVMTTALAGMISRPWRDSQRVMVVSKPYRMADLVTLVDRLVAE